MSNRVPEGWELRYADKVKAAQQVVQLIEAGQHVIVGTACATPRALVAALENLPKRPPDVELIHFLTTNAFPHDEGAAHSPSIGIGPFS